jgi:hypothetical protein
MLRMIGGGAYSVPRRVECVRGDNRPLHWREQADALIETVAESDAASRWPHLPARPLKMVLFVL